MRSFYWAVVGFGLASPVAAAEIEVASRVDAVTVYQGSAEITRAAEVSIPAGEHVLVFKGLNSELDERSVRAAIGSDRVAIGALDLQFIELADLASEGERELTAKLEALQAQRASVSDTIASANLQLKFLDNISKGYGENAFRESLSGTADPGKWAAALEFLGSGDQAARNGIRDARAQLRGIDREIDLVQRQLKEARSGRRSTIDLHVAVFADGDVTTTAAITFRVDQATWEPVYRLRLDSDAGRLRLTRQAQVTQFTGEDWTDVALTLASGQPSEEVEAPELGSEFLTLRDRQLLAASRVRSEAPQKDGFETLQPPTVVARGFMDARGFGGIVVSAYSVEYSIPGRVSLDTGIATKTFRIAEHDLPVEVIVRVVPRLDEVAYVIGRHVWEGAEFLLPGEAAIYRDNAYVGVGELGIIRPGDEVDFPLGSDPLVEVSHDTDGGARSDKGFLGRDNVQQQLWVMEITNRHSGDMKFEIIDRLPVAGDEDIEVTVLDTATPADEVGPEGEPGILYWRPTLAPGETATIRHHYQVRYPKDKVLVRKNRE